MDFSAALRLMKEGKIISNGNHYVLAKYTIQKGKILDINNVVLCQYDADDKWILDDCDFTWEEILDDNWEVIE